MSRDYMNIQPLLICKLCFFVALIKGWNEMKSSGWRRPNDAKALNQTEKGNPTTVFKMLKHVLHNGSKFVCER